MLDVGRNKGCVVSCDNGQKIGYNDIANNLMKYDSYKRH